MALNNNIKFYLYLDEGKGGIDSIYNQLFDFDESLELFSNLDLKNKVQIVTNRSYEQKVEYIHKKLFDRKISFLSDVLNNIKISSSKLVVCKDIFRLKLAYDDDTGTSLSAYQIQSRPYDYKKLSFVFESIPKIAQYDSKINLQNQAINDGDYYVDMYINGDKIIRGIRHITNEIKYGKDFMFIILAEISYCGDKYYSLKPFAIWRETDRNL